MAKAKSERTAAGRALFELGMEVIHTYFRLRAAGEKIGATTPAGAGSWGLLRSLAREGPQTVPQLARARPVSRQHIQMLANELAGQGLVEFVDNPAHKRSRLVRITARGRERLAEVSRRIEDAYETIAPGMDERAIRDAAAVLAELRARLAAF